MVCLEMTTRVSFIVVRTIWILRKLRMTLFFGGRMIGGIGNCTPCFSLDLNTADKLKHVVRRRNMPDPPCDQCVANINTRWATLEISRRYASRNDKRGEAPRNDKWGVSRNDG